MSKHAWLMLVISACAPSPVERLDDGQPDGAPSVDYVPASVRVTVPANVTSQEYRVPTAQPFVASGTRRPSGEWREVGRENPIAAIWGGATDDVWAVGGAGTILHWDGHDWNPVPSGTTETLLGIWGSAPNDVWAVGQRWVSSQATLIHWD